MSAFAFDNLYILGLGNILKVSWILIYFEQLHSLILFHDIIKLYIQINYAKESQIQDFFVLWNFSL